MKIWKFDHIGGEPMIRKFIKAVLLENVNLPDVDE